MMMAMMNDREACEAWDCDPAFIPFDESYDLDLDEEDSTGDWQVLVLDRFGDRMVTDSLRSRGFNNKEEEEIDYVE